MKIRYQDEGWGGDQKLGRHDIGPYQEGHSHEQLGDQRQAWVPTLLMDEDVE